MRLAFRTGHRLQSALAVLALVMAPAINGAEDAGTPAPALPESPPPEETHVESLALYAEWGLDPATLPYRKDVNARHEFESAVRRARAGQKLLMVAFGANWCEDCRALHRQLDAEPVRSFVAGHYEIVAVDVGDFDRNLALAADLGVDLQMGIPVAVFFAADGSPIGATNRGELEPARTYTSRQILKFLQDIANEGRIAAPSGQ